MSDLTTRDGAGTPDHGHDANSEGPDDLARPLFRGPGGLPAADIPHRPRRSDIDPKAARRAERQVATLFILSMVMVVLFVVAYVAIDPYVNVYVPVFGEIGYQNFALGLTFGLGVFCIGAGAIQWAKKLMPDTEVVQERHSLRSTKHEDVEAAEQYERGKEESGFGQYRIIRRTLIAALALYEHRTHHLLCPCHQSTFDLADAGNVIFGPAARRMPQLPIGVDEEGFLVARAPFAQPVGPSFWERG